MSARGTKRSARACLACRKSKRTCDSTEPCARCVKHGGECVYDRPAPPVVDDPLANRLIAMESLLLHLVQNMENLSNNVTQILSNQTQGFGSVPSSTQRPPSSFSGSVVADPMADQSPAFQTAGEKLPLPDLIDTAFTLRQHVELPPSDGNDAIDHISEMSSPAGGYPLERESFETSLDAPIQALEKQADVASRFVPHHQSVLAEESRLAEHGPTTHETVSTGASGGIDMNEDEGRPKKRMRIALLPTKTASMDQRDVVAKGIVSEQQARDWFTLFQQRLLPYCTIMNPIYDTFDSIRSRSHFLFNTVMYLTARTSSGPNPPSPTLVLIAEEIRVYIQSLIFETNPPLEVIQALVFMAVWHDEPYYLSGYALRMALSIRLEATFAQFDAHGWEKTDLKAQQLIARVRCWYHLVFVEFKHSANTGRLILISPDDIAVLERNIDKIFLSPLSMADDNRPIANLKLTIMQRKILRRSPSLALMDPCDRVRHLQSLHHTLEDCFKSYEGPLAMQYPTDGEWSRRSHFRILTEGKLFLSCLVLKKTLLERSPHTAVVEAAHETFNLARSSYQTVIQSSTYTNSIQYSGFLARVGLSFACLISLKLATLYPVLAEPNEIVSEVLQVADLMAGCSGSQRYSMALRVASEHFITRTGPSRTEPPPFIDPIAALHLLSHSQQPFGNPALLPGEVEIDWTSLATSFGNQSNALNGDWIPYSSFSTDTWLEDFA